MLDRIAIYAPEDVAAILISCFYLAFLYSVIFLIIRHISFGIFEAIKYKKTKFVRVVKEVPVLDIGGVDYKLSCGAKARFPKLISKMVQVTPEFEANRKGRLFAADVEGMIMFLDEYGNLCKDEGLNQKDFFKFMEDYKQRT